MSTEPTTAIPPLQSLVDHAKETKKRPKPQTVNPAKLLLEAVKKHITTHLGKKASLGKVQYGLLYAAVAENMLPSVLAHNIIYWVNSDKFGRLRVRVQANDKGTVITYNFASMGDVFSKSVVDALAVYICSFESVKTAGALDAQLVAAEDALTKMLTPAPMSGEEAAMLGPSDLVTELPEFQATPGPIIEDVDDDVPPPKKARVETSKTARVIPNTSAQLEKLLQTIQTLADTAKELVASDNLKLRISLSP